MADLIPSEIWSYHIFTKLPTKSLSRVRCVCRVWNDAWNDAISDPVFVRTYLLRQNQHVYLEYINKDGSTYAVNCEINESNGTCTAKPTKKIFTEIIEIKCSSNGIFFGLVRILNKDDLAIWNPSTEDFKLIPAAPCYNREQYGFYYDPFTGVATVVIFEYNLINKSQAHIYSSLKPDSWKLIENSSIFDQDVIVRGFYRDGNGCSTNGFIYWMVDKKRTTISDQRILSGVIVHVHIEVMETDYFIEWILVFDIKNRKFRTMRPPFSRTPTHCLRLQLGVLGSNIMLYGLPNGREFVVWIPKEGESEEWIKFDITLAESVTGKYPLCSMRNQKILLIYFNGSDGIVKVMLYDLQSQHVQDLSVSGIDNIRDQQIVQDSRIDIRKWNCPNKHVAFVSFN